MKNQYLFFFMIAIGMVISGFNKADGENAEASISYEVPENIASIIDQSCIMCHNSESKNEKAKKKLQLDKMGHLKKSKLISKLNKIANEVEDGEMPPEKFLKHNPDKALSEADEDALINWARSYIEELSK